MLKNRTVKNAIWIIWGRVVQAVLNLLITMLTARFLGPSNFGLINYAMSIVAFAVPIMQLGITSVLVQELIVSPEKEGDTLGTALVSCFVSGILCIIGVTSFVIAVDGNEPETLWVCGLYSLTLLAQALECTTYWFQAHLLSKYSSIISLIAYLVVSLYKVYLLVTRKSVVWFAISNALDYLLIAIALIIVYRKLGGQPLSFSLFTCRRLIHKGKYYILSGLMITVFSQTDRVMLKLMIDDSATGFYSAAVTCAGMTGFIVSAIIDSARPSIFKSKKNSAESFERNMTLLYSIVIYFALFQSIFINIFAKWIVYILYGQAYSATIPALKIIVWYTTFSYIGAVRNVWILAEEKQSVIWKIDVSGAIANVLLNYILIPYWGVNGAAIASLITQIFTNIIVVGIIKSVRYNIWMMINSLNPRNLLSMIKEVR